MSKPDDIPQDVWDAASKVATAPRVTGALFSENYVLPIARAILSERERCAKVATDQAEREPYGHCKATCFIIADNIMGGN